MLKIKKLKKINSVIIRYEDALFLNQISQKIEFHIFTYEDSTIINQDM